MNYITSLFTKKEKRKNYFELPSKIQKRILNKAARETSIKKKELLKKHSVNFSS